MRFAKIDRYTGKATTYLHPSDGKGATHIHSLMEYAPHQLLIGSDDGLLLFNTLTCEHQLFTEDETNPYSLSNRFVYPIVKDREGGIWIGTFYGGVNYLSPNTGQFECFAHSRFPILSMELLSDAFVKTLTGIFGLPLMMVV